MSRTAPPRWLDHLLQSLLSARDRETISGDLLEEYSEERLPRLGSLRANLWYLRQCLSFASIRLGGSTMKQVSIAMCLFVAASCGWLALMENLLKHAGYTGRTALDICLSAQAVGTSLCLLLNVPGVVRLLVLVCAMIAAGFGGFAVISVLRAQHFEGYILVIGVALVLEGLFALATFLRMHFQPAA